MNRALVCGPGYKIGERAKRPNVIERTKHFRQTVPGGWEADGEGGEGEGRCGGDAPSPASGLWPSSPWPGPRLRSGVRSSNRSTGAICRLRRRSSPRGGERGSKIITVWLSSRGELGPGFRRDAG